MKIEIEVPDQLIKEILENLPEYAESFRCTDWDYEATKFTLIDYETEEGHTLDLEKAREGFRRFAALIFAGKLPGLSISASNMFDASNWDAADTDAYLQCCVLGEVIYG